MNGSEDTTSSAARVVLGVIVRILLKVIGTALVTRGLTDQGTVDGITATLVEAIVGATMVGAGSAWSVVHALFEHSRFALRWNALLKPPAPPPGSAPTKP